jgi:hypothetical protein
MWTAVINRGHDFSGLLDILVAIHFWIIAKKVNYPIANGCDPK